MPDFKDVMQHNSKESCWIIIGGNAYDMTAFVDDHPGGSDAIMRTVQKNTRPSTCLAPSRTTLPKDKDLGPVSHLPESKTAASANTETQSSPIDILPLSACQSLEDLEAVDKARLSPHAAAYYNSAADLPVFIAPATMAKLGHEDGERCLARGAARMDIAQCVCIYSSVPVPDVMECFRTDPHRRDGALFFQLYVPKDKNGAKALIKRAKELGFKALVVTVDSPVIGKRDSDDRFKALRQHSSGQSSGNVVLPPLPGHGAQMLRGVHCSNFTWRGLVWIRRAWSDLPIVLKGIQTAEDAAEAMKHDVQGIYLSNHGGRQVDYAPIAVDTLIDIRLQCPEVLKKLDVYVYGGVMRGLDILKALCLGARRVGIGRGFLYALSAYGNNGVVSAINILSDELQTTMRLLGVTSLSQLSENYVDISEILSQRQHYLRRPILKL
ncbi:hypothetical protein VHEMI06142 [[Torrubiella] hemipterigena]|uniref:Cytochrome b2 n=1 Tax=[Torrubiella] hemipterigena TaxID=1531966 RepID=A0A0A1SZT7_9HYPO|nr:hypothetical protein VHEMI06142 [[Torrubiella] hemipterigena]